MGMLQLFQDCGAIIREIAGWVKRILDMPAMFVWYFKEENTLRFWRLCGTVEGIGGQPVCRHGAAYRLGTGRKTSCGGSAEQHWNRHSPTLIVATVTTRTEKKKNQPTHVLVDSNPAFEEPSMILLEQIFTIDKSRIERFMGYASKAEMLRIDMALLVSLALNVLSGNRSE